GFHHSYSLSLVPFFPISTYVYVSVFCVSFQFIPLSLRHSLISLSPLSLSCSFILVSYFVLILLLCLALLVPLSFVYLSLSLHLSLSLSLSPSLPILSLSYL